MARPDDIPEWAWEKAGRVAKETARNAMVDPLMPYYISAQPLVARAILAAVEEEREAILQFEFDLPVYRNGADMMVATREYIRNRRGA